MAANITTEIRANGVALLWVDVINRSHNVLNRQVMRELEAAFDAAASDQKIKLLAILSRKAGGFFAGADLEEFKGVSSAADATAISHAGQRLFDKLAGLRIPSVAIIHGVCLGGGLELALACDYRIVVDHPKTSIGLPEVQLGILPGWGGTQRLPRVVGIERAISVILAGKSLDASDAKRWALADIVARSTDDAIDMLSSDFGERMRREGKRSLNAPPGEGWRHKLLERNPLGRWLLFRGAAQVVRRKAPDDMPGPFEALEAIRVGMTRGMAAGLEYERNAIGRLATTKACRNLVTLFFLDENARKSPEENGQAPREIKTLGVVGAGTMGAGIAQLAALKGFKVFVQEVNDAALGAGVNKIEGLFQKMVDKGRLTRDEAANYISGIGKTTSWEGFREADLVIEAVIEDIDLKKRIFSELERRSRADTILVSNTSSLSVARIQEGMSRPQQIAGLHFFNPVHKMRLVEVLWGPQTDKLLLPVLTNFAAALGKTPVVVRDSTGFLVNRILFPYLNEAGLLVAEGMPVEEVDRVMLRFGMYKMGPLKLLDQIGLDVAAHVAKTVTPVFGDRLRPHPGLDQMVQRGWLGQKSGAGFYKYNGKKPEINAEAKSLMLRNGQVAAVDATEARDRMVLLMVNEAAACLGEGLAESADRIDLAMVLGTGWAPHRGGPLRYADDRGAKDIVRTLDELAHKFGPRFTPTAELMRRATSGEKFYDSLDAVPLGGRA